MRLEAAASEVQPMAKVFAKRANCKTDSLRVRR